MKLLIVESPNKIRKIRSILGNGWRIMASVGHIEDLPSNDFGIDEELNFTYVPIAAKQKKTISELRQAIRAADEIYIATDPDREGEAIAWSIWKLVPRGKQGKVKRIAFNAITREDVMRGLGNPRQIDMNLVHAQQARRAMDRVIGYILSPEASRHLGGKYSVGRVQSPAVNLVVERNNEIEAFRPEPFWVIEADVSTLAFAGQTFRAVHPEIYKAESKAREVFGRLGTAFTVGKVKSYKTSSSPPPPFTTSSLQKAAYQKFGMPPSKTMKVAQRLYEAGRLTYIRSDSPWISEEGLVLAKDYILKEFGKDYYKARNFEAKGVAQEAHECIRPTSIRMPGGLPEDERRLLSLVRERFFASQMSPARFQKVDVVMDNNGVVFTASGKRLIFDGYRRLTGGEPDEMILPPLKRGDVLGGRAEIQKKFTKPPAPFNDASLVDTLERHGIGRPSTYAAILSTIRERGYVRTNGKKKALQHTQEAERLIGYLRSNYSWLLNLDFTKEMEHSLDLVAGGKLRRNAVIMRCLERLGGIQALGRHRTNIQERRPSRPVKTSSGSRKTRTRKRKPLPRTSIRRRR